MKKLLFLILAFLAFSSSQNLKAQDFFDTSDAPDFFTFGARMGFNTSNRTFPPGNYSNMVFTSWGTGFNAGVVSYINFKEFLALQPGLFFESRSGNLVNISEYYVSSSSETYYEKDHQRAYYFTIPIMGIVRFNLSNRIKWLIELGPYFQFCLKETGGQNDVNLFTRDPQSTQYYTYKAKHRGYDAGLKIGTGLQVYNHVYVGVHYEGGFCNAWIDPAGGKNKSWSFTLGYDF